jgi:hypothetical protein
MDLKDIYCGKIVTQLKCDQEFNNRTQLWKKSIFKF